MTIQVKYSCKGCRIYRATFDVPAREPDEEVTDWMGATVRLVAQEHRRRSPFCRSKELQELMIPMLDPAGRVGGPTVQ
jgi:hypothetical protein